jgi:hypothetical protein
MSAIVASPAAPVPRPMSSASFKVSASSAGEGFSKDCINIPSVSSACSCMPFVPITRPAPLAHLPPREAYPTTCFHACTTHDSGTKYIWTLTGPRNGMAQTSMSGASTTSGGPAAGGCHHPSSASQAGPPQDSVNASQAASAIRIVSAGARLYFEDRMRPSCTAPCRAKNRLAVLVYPPHQKCGERLPHRKSSLLSPCTCFIPAISAEQAPLAMHAGPWQTSCGGA